MSSTDSTFSQDTVDPDLLGGDDLKFHGKRKQRYIENLRRLQKLLKEDKVDLTQGAALTILSQCRDALDGDGKPLAECTPGSNCPNLELLRNSKDPDLHRIYNTRAFRSGKAFQCIPENLIMADDRPADKGLRSRFNAAVAVIGRESKNIANIQRWRTDIEAKQCSMLTADLLRGEGEAEQGDPDDNYATRNASEMCNRAAACTWLPTESADYELKSSVGDDSHQALKGTCAPTLDALATQLREEAERIVSITGGENLTLSADATEQYKNALANIFGPADDDKFTNADGGQFIDRDTGDPLPALDKQDKLFRDSVLKHFNKYRADRGKAQEKELLEKSVTDNQSKMLERWVQMKTMEDTDTKCHAAGSYTGATVKDCNTTSTDPDGKKFQNDADQLCGVVDPTTGRIVPKDEDDARQLKDGEQCRYVGGEGVTWTTEHDVNQDRHIVKALRTTTSAEELARIKLLAQGQSNPTDNDVNTMKDEFEKQVEENKTELEKVVQENLAGGGLKDGLKNRLKKGGEQNTGGEKAVDLYPHYLKLLKKSVGLQEREMKGKTKEERNFISKLQAADNDSKFKEVLKGAPSVGPEAVRIKNVIQAHRKAYELMQQERQKKEAMQRVATAAAQNACELRDKKWVDGKCVDKDDVYDRGLPSNTNNPNIDENFLQEYYGSIADVDASMMTEDDAASTAHTHDAWDPESLSLANLA